jgi:hypothetical protein
MRIWCARAVAYGPRGIHMRTPCDSEPFEAISKATMRTPFESGQFAGRQPGNRFARWASFPHAGEPG